MENLVTKPQSEQGNGRPESPAVPLPPRFLGKKTVILRGCYPQYMTT
jgi:hypothetical protein